ncbi:hypothetical protein [Streptomyces nojiriensis]|uniref:hypothetical protein n=1 Tax=Streptomyces nojiriensis TaxID=66374 RepID=UPI00364C440E
MKTRDGWGERALVVAPQPIPRSLVGKEAVIDYGNGDVEHVTPQVRADVRAAITTSLERDRPVCIQDLMDRGAIQTRPTDAAKSNTDPSRRSYRDSRK